jgi:hypothetical protein
MRTRGTAIGDDDPDYDPQVDSTLKRHNSIPAPLGIRGQGGIITALPDEGSVEEAQYGGVHERAPTKLQEMVRLQNCKGRGFHVLSMKGCRTRSSGC